MTDASAQKIHEKLHLCRACLIARQILVLGKLMQPALLSWAAYRDQEVFRRRSGMEKSVLISEPRTGTQARPRPSVPSF